MQSAKQTKKVAGTLRRAVRQVAGCAAENIWPEQPFFSPRNRVATPPELRENRGISYSTGLRRVATDVSPRCAGLLSRVARAAVRYGFSPRREPGDKAIANQTESPRSAAEQGRNVRHSWQPFVGVCMFGSGPCSDETEQNARIAMATFQTMLRRAGSISRANPGSPAAEGGFSRTGESKSPAGFRSRALELPHRVGVHRPRVPPRGIHGLHLSPPRSGFSELPRSFS